MYRIFFKRLKIFLMSIENFQENNKWGHRAFLQVTSV